MATLKTLERRLGLPTAATYNRVRSAEQKVKAIFPHTEFLLVVGSDNALHLRAYAGARSMREVTELLKDDLAGFSA